LHLAPDVDGGPAGAGIDTVDEDERAGLDCQGAAGRDGNVVGDVYYSAPVGVAGESAGDIGDGFALEVGNMPVGAGAGKGYERGAEAVVQSNLVRREIDGRIVAG